MFTTKEDIVVMEAWYLKLTISFLICMPTKFFYGDLTLESKLQPQF